MPDGAVRAGQAHQAGRRQFTVSLSKLDCYRSCRRQYFYRYMVRAKPLIQSATLLYGITVHEAIEGFLTEGADPVEQFKAAWAQRLNSEPVQFTKTMGPEDLTAVGELSLKRFVQWWHDSGLVVALMPDGQPMVELNLAAQIHEDLILWGKIDMVAFDQNDRVLILDNKTPATPCGDDFPLVADQLTDYQVLVEANGESLGLDGVDAMGYIELVKKKVPKSARGEGPQIHLSTLAPARTDDQKRAWLGKVVNDVHDIRRGIFPKDPGPAFRSACDMCDFRTHCLYGLTDGLVIPDDRREILARGPRELPLSL